MKQFKFYSMAFAAMMLAACSSSDDVATDNPNVNEDGTSYLTVNLSNVLDMPGTRAEATYENGSGLENTINKVRFYFFYQDGSAFKLDGQTYNYIDETSMTFTDQTTGGNVEKISNVQILLKGEKREAPSSMVAVINPDICGIKDQAMSLQQLRSAVYSDFYKSKEEGGVKAGFVMSNSVYEQTGTDMCATLVEGHVKATQAEATADPVDIYVERVNAKVTVTKGTDSEKWTKLKLDGTETDAAYVGDYAIREYNEETGAWEENTKKIYALQFGWNLSDEDGKAELTKNINTSWTNDLLGITPWSSADLHRSFWSTSVAFGAGTNVGDNTPVYPKYTDCTTAFGSSLYTLPNTPTKAIAEDDAYKQDNTLTKVVVKAQLVTADGDNNATPLQVTEYKAIKYISPDAVKMVIANEYGQYYKKETTTSESGTQTVTYTKIAPEDFDFYGKGGVKFNAKGKDGASNNSALNDLKDYQVAAQLNSKITELYVKSGETWEKAADNAISNMNANLIKYPASIAANGATYYFTPIRHLANNVEKVGYYGVVRNHSYKVTINSITGLGTPVWNPDSETTTINPELPNDDKTFLAAKINVLSWRVVDSTVDLDKTK